jgi:hypothetical protein
VRYIRVQWLHSFPDVPIRLVSEINEHGRETRKVEIFRNGSKGYAVGDEEVGGTVLGEKPVPPLDEIAADPQFIPNELTKAAFEMIWAARQSIG